MIRDVNRPNLFLIGAMKSSTTFLSGLLGAHPEIFMARPEEPSFFVDPGQLKKIWPYVWDQGFWRSEQAYLQLFDEAGHCSIVGEASTNYSKLTALWIESPSSIHRHDSSTS